MSSAVLNRLSQMTDDELLALSPLPRNRSPEATECEGSLHTFVQEAWSIVESEVEFADNWHIRAICDHLQALTEGRLDRDNMLVNVPPGTMKSLLVCVFWPAWVWTTRPGSRWAFFSYSQSVSVRDSLKRRKIITDRWYRANWGKRTALVNDQNQRTKFENESGGWMLSSSVGGAATGEHMDYLITDDPINADDAETEVGRESNIRWWSGTITTRGQSRKVRKVVVMQRLHEKDLSGYLMESETFSDEWCHLCLPMEFELDRMQETTLGFSDPRTEIDELLWPELFPRSKVDSMKSGLGPAKVEGQFQQRPPTNYADSEWPASYFGPQIWFDDIEFPGPENVQFSVVAWDPSLGKTDKSDYSAFVELTLDRDGGMWIDADLARRDASQQAKLAVQIGHRLKPWAFGIEDEGFQNLLQGQVDEESRRAGMMLPIYLINSGGISKMVRIRRLTPFLARGDFRFRKDSFGTKLLVDQLKAFPGGRHDDGPDALEQALRLVEKIHGGEVE